MHHFHFQIPESDDGPAVDMKLDLPLDTPREVLQALVDAPPEKIRALAEILEICRAIDDVLADIEEENLHAEH